MSDVRAAADNLLRKRPELEDDLEALLAIDADGPWTFDDIPLDSGTFGEIAATEIVESVDDAYTIRDRSAVQAAIAEGPAEPTNEADPDAAERSHTTGPETTGPGLGAVRQHLATLWSSIATVDSSRATLAGVLLFVFIMRTAISWDGVFRDGHIALTGNDPYFYRYWLEELIRGAPPSTTIANFGEPLMLATVWAATILLGGTQQAAGLVLAWYPVIAAMIVGGLLYWITTAVFDDPRVGYATVAFYAITPILSYRSGLGFGDHHAFDYLLLTVTVAGLVALATDTSHWRAVTSRRIAGGVAVIVGTTGAVHAWTGGGPLLVAPVIVYILLRPYTDARAGTDTLRTNVWLLGSLGCSAVAAIAIHTLLGWSPAFHSGVPLLLFSVAASIVAISTFCRQYGLRPRTVLGVEIGTGTVVVGLMLIAVPTAFDFIVSGSERVFRLTETDIVETYGLLDASSGGLLTPIFYFGTAFLLSIAGLVWVTYKIANRDSPEQLVIVSFGWSLLAAGLVQLRFAAFFGIISAVFTGVTFVHLLTWLDVTSPVGEPSSSRTSNEEKSVTESTLPTPGAMVVILLLFGLVGGFSITASVAQTTDTEVTDSQFEAALAIDEHAAAENITWSNNYVLSPWGENRIYNYIVSGQSRSYVFAEDNYVEFISSNNPGNEEDVRRRAGYIIIKTLPTTSGGQVPPSTIQARLNQHWGSATKQVDGLSGYRAIHQAGDIKVYQVVPGAKIRWMGEPNTTQAIETATKINDRVISYKRRVTSDKNGQYSVRVAYPGTYEFSGLNATVEVSETAVTDGFAVPFSSSR